MFYTSAIMGAILMIISILAIREQMRIKTHGVSIIGEVVGTSTQRARTKRGIRHLNTVVCYPIVAYIIDGVEYKSRSPVGHSAPKYCDGEKITILYNPKNFNSFIVEGEKQNVALYVAYFLIGAALLIIGAILFFTQKSILE